MALDLVAYAQRLQVIPSIVPLLEKVIGEHATDLADQKRLLLKLLRSRVVAHLLARLVDEDLVVTQTFGGLLGRHLRTDRHPELGYAAVEVMKAVSGSDSVGSATRPGEGLPGEAELLFLRAQELAELPGFKSLQLGELLESWVDTFIAPRDGESADWVELSRALRLYMADRLESRRSTGFHSLVRRDESGDIEEILTIIAMQPARFNELFSLVGRASRPGGDLQSFAELARRSLDSLAPSPSVKKAAGNR